MKVYMLNLNQFKTYKDFMEYKELKAAEYYEMKEIINEISDNISHISTTGMSEFEILRYKNYLYREFESTELYELFCCAAFSREEADGFNFFLIKDITTLIPKYDKEVISQTLEYVFQKLKDYQLIEENKKVRSLS